MGIFVCGLGCYHCTLVAKNATTYENMRPFDHHLSILTTGIPPPSPFDRGFLRNWWTILTGDHSLASTLTRRTILSAYKSLFPDSSTLSTTAPDIVRCSSSYSSSPSKEDVLSRMRSSRSMGNGVELSYFQTSEATPRTTIDLSKAKNT
eukprot:TRINITY_DN10245_c0_g1_i1.p1 TRINITY_DN10245_c0_g1~~TRINITY_DN10245_c0_g1_i1.p1  ORF type:complete len:168 (+),score=0.93 TRINITY_DN10245_c0_g1_i1:60-506(+)